MKRFFASSVCLLLLLSDLAKATVVFTDTFTVGADANLNAYPATPDYAMTEGAATDLVVTAATDNVVVAVGTDASARLIDGTAPTGDQQITASLDSTGTLALATRMATGGTVNYYLARFNGSTVVLARLDSGSYVELVDCGARTYGLAYTARFKAAGTGATVSLEAQVDATAVCTYDDSDANRKTSGVPGIFSGGAVGSTFDNLSVDDLAVASNKSFYFYQQLSQP